MRLRMGPFFVLASCIFTASFVSSQTTVAQEKANNTSASSSFAGYSDDRSGVTILTNPFDEAPRNISKQRGTSWGDVHNLMYSGFNGLILAETQEWFCTTNQGNFQRDGQNFPQCNSHNIVGYDSSANASAMVDDMYNRGFDGFVADAMGGQNNCGYPNFNSSCGGGGYAIRDNAIRNMQAEVNNQYSSAMHYAIMEDEAAFVFTQNCANYAGTTQYPGCIEAKLKADLSYYNSTFFGDSTYLKDPSSGQPIILFFMDEPDFSACAKNSCQLAERSCNSQADCWQGMWDGLRNYGIAAKFIFENDGGLNPNVSSGGHPDTNGGYAWVTPDAATGSSVTTTTQLDWNDSWGSGNTQNYLGDFYNTANSYGDTLVFGVAYKGYDEEDAPFHDPNGRVAAQQCGQTWLKSFAAPSAGGFYNSGHQLPFMMVATWDDYEEGSATEMGIDNCVNDSSFSESINGSTLSWSFQFSDSTYGTTNTLDHYVLYETTDGTNLYPVDSNISQSACSFSSPTVSCSVNLQSYSWASGTYTLYVKEISRPSIANHFSSNGVSYVVNGQKILNVSPSSLSFGTEPVGQTSGSQGVTLSSAGSEAVDISSISTSGDFAQTNNCPSSLAPNSSCTVNVTFTPTTSGNRTGTLTIQDDAGGNPQTVSLSGTGGCAYCNVDDLSGWNACGDSGCAGGNGTATYSLTQNVGNPSLDGGSTQFALTGGPAYSDIKYWNQQSLVSGSSFTNDLYAYITNTNAVQGLGFGVTQDVGGLKYTFRYMCDFRGTTHWLLWDSANGDWYDTGIACSTSDFPSNNWIHLTFYFQHTSGNQMLYQSFTVNGVNHSVNVTLNPEVENDSPFIQFQILQWGDYEQDTYSVYVDDWNVSVQ